MELQRITIWIILGTVLLIQTSLAVELDNSGGGTWQENITFYLKSATAEYGHYKIVIDESACKIYNVMGDPKACQPNGNFWSLVQSDGEDIRVYNQSAQLYFWIEKWDYANKTAVIWVNISAGSEELNIAYGNPSALRSNYENGEHVFEFFDDFEDGVLDTAKWAYDAGTPSESGGIVTISGGNLRSVPTFTQGVLVYRGYHADNYDIRTGFTDTAKTANPNNAIRFVRGMSLHYAAETFVSGSRYTADLASNPWGSWHIFKIVWGSTAKFYVDDTLQAEITNVPTVNMSIEWWSASNNPKIQVDWVFVAKLADPADFYTPGGEPETNTTHIVSFKVYRCFKPVKNVPVKVKYNGKLVCCGYTDDTGSIAFRLDKLKTYEIDINHSEKIVTIQPLEHNYIITLPCNITMEGETATYNQTFGNYTWDLLKIGQNISSQLSPSARGFLSGIIAWLLMYGTSSLGLTSPVPGIIALAGLAVVGFTDWIVVLLCAVFSAGMYIIRRNLG